MLLLDGALVFQSLVPPWKQIYIQFGKFLDMVPCQNGVTPLHFKTGYMDKVALKVTLAYLVTSYTLITQPQEASSVCKYNVKYSNYVTV